MNNHTYQLRLTFAQLLLQTLPSQLPLDIVSIHSGLYIITLKRPSKIGKNGGDVNDLLDASAAICICHYHALDQFNQSLRIHLWMEKGEVFFAKATFLSTSIVSWDILPLPRIAFITVVRSDSLLKPQYIRLKMRQPRDHASLLSKT